MFIDEGRWATPILLLNPSTFIFARGKKQRRNIDLYMSWLLTALIKDYTEEISKPLLNSPAVLNAMPFIIYDKESHSWIYSLTRFYLLSNLIATTLITAIANRRYFVLSTYIWVLACLNLTITQ